MYSLRTVSQPTVEPVTLERFKAHLRLDADDEDDLLTGYLRSARSLLEGTAQRAFLPQTVAFSLDRFPFGWFGHQYAPHAAQGSSSVPSFVDRYTIRVPRPACLAVKGITYVDPSGVAQQLDPSAYLVDFDSEPARIVPAMGFVWPAGEWFTPGTVKVTYIAGTYADNMAEQLMAVAGNGGATVQLSRNLAGGPVTLQQGSTPVPCTVRAPNLLAVDASLAGQSVTATYYGMNVPPHVEMAVLMLAAHWYRNREAASDTQMQEVPMGVQALIAPEISYAGVYEL